MTYPISAFYLLDAVAREKSSTLETAYTTLCMTMGYPVPLPCLSHALHCLLAGGYVVLGPHEGRVSAATPLKATEEGKAILKLSLHRRLFGKAHALQKIALSFSEMTLPPLKEDGLLFEGKGFEECAELLMRTGHLSLPLFHFQDTEDGLIRLTIQDPSIDCDEEAEEGPSSTTASITGTAEQLRAAVKELIDTALAMVTQPHRARKLALHGQDRSLLISLATAVNAEGLVSLRMTVSAIRFNRWRFLGKRNSDLDYAQCGDPLLLLEWAGEKGFVLHGVLHPLLARPDLLGEEESDALQCLYRYTL